MINQEVFSSDFYAALFANEDIYLVASEIAKKEIVNLPIEENRIAKEIVEEKPKELTKSNQGNKIIPLLILSETSTESNKVFLEKVLNAVHLSLDDVELFTISDLKAKSFSELSEDKSYLKIISFGVPFSMLNLDIMLMPYQNTNFEGIWFLMVEKLIVVENDVSHKRKLWACLQELFKS